MNDVKVVPGEMADWTDYGPARGPAGGAVLEAWLAAVVPDGGDVLFVGPHDDDLVRQMAGRVRTTTLLVRSTSDALRLSDELPEVEVVAGGIAGWSRDAGDRTFSTVIALDGLDRLGSNDERPSSWQEKLEVVQGSVQADGILVVGGRSPLRAADILDARPATERHGDEEFIPLFNDSTRPGTLVEFRDRLARSGQGTVTAWAGFGAPQAPDVLVRAEAPVDGPLAEAARAAAVAAHQHWLADPAEYFAAARQGGSLEAVADVWVAVLGSVADAPDALVAIAAKETVLVGTAEDGSWSVRGPEPDSHRSFPQGDSVEDTLFTLLEFGDVPAVRELSRRVGSWAAATRPGLITLSQLVQEGEGFAHAWWLPEETSAPEVSYLAAQRATIERLRRSHRRHPWPPWLMDGSLVEVLAREAGFRPTPELIEESGRLATRLVTLTHPEAGVIDHRRALADYEELHHQLFEAKGHIAGLERVLKFRDQQLRAGADETSASTVTTSRARRLVAGVRKQLRPAELTRIARRVATTSSLSELKEGARRVAGRVRRG